MMAEDCQAIVRGCSCCQAYEGEVPRAPLCPIRAYALLELVHLDYTSIESTMELNKPPVVKNILVMTDHFTRYALAVVTAKTVAKVAKLLSDRGQTSRPPCLRSCALPLVSRSAEPRLTTHSAMGRWSISIRHYST